jgi:hypothetical protein
MEVNHTLCSHSLQRKMAEKERRNSFHKCINTDIRTKDFLFFNVNINNSTI